MAQMTAQLMHGSYLCRNRDCKEFPRNSLYSRGFQELEQYARTHDNNILSLLRERVCPREGRFSRRGISEDPSVILNVMSVSYTHLDVYKRQTLR